MSLPKIPLTRRSLLQLATAGGLLWPSLTRASHTAPAMRTMLLSTAAGRSVEISVWRTTHARRGTLLFSHGAMSAPWKYEALLATWVAAGYDVYAPLHVDSTSHPLTSHFKGFLSWRARIEDMRALSAHVNQRYLAVGHSYGGLTALTMGGASASVPDGVTGPLRDPLAVAVVAFSPPSPVPGLISAEGFATLAVPALIQSGTADNPPNAPGPEGWRTHLAAYDAAQPGGDRYALVLSEVDHYFGGAICTLDRPGPKRLTELASAAEISQLFFAAYGTKPSRQALAALQARLSDKLPVMLSRR